MRAITQPFNWLTFLQEAMKKEPTEERCRRAYALAGSWPTCACGELCKALPRDECGEPLDGELGPLGCRFLGYIGNRQWRNALETFRAIEARTAFLLTQRRNA